MTKSSTYFLYFEGVSHADANRHAEELRHVLLDASSLIQVSRHRADPHTQDGGSILVLVLGTPAIVAVVTALGNWLKIRRQVSLTIEQAETKIHLNNVTQQTALTALEHWFTTQQLSQDTKALPLKRRKQQKRDQEDEE